MPEGDNYLGQFLGHISAVQESERHEQRMSELALQTEIKKQQLQQEFQSNVHKTWGKNLADHAKIISSDPKEQERIGMMGQIMAQTGMPPEVVLGYLKTGTAEELAGIKQQLGEQKIQIEKGKLELGKGKLTQQKVYQTKRLSQYDRALDLAAQRLQKTKTVVPETIKTAMQNYKSVLNKAESDVSAGRQSDIASALEQYSDEINLHADTINEWATEQGIPLVPTVAEEVQTPGIARRFLMKFGVPGPSPTKKLTKPGAAEAPKKTPKDRAIELMTEHADWTDTQVRDQLKTEGLLK